MPLARIAIATSLLLALATTAHAAPKNFHVGAGCPYTTINAALDAERVAPGTPADFIWIARNQAYYAQDIQIHDQNVFLYGGVDSCTDTSISGKTELSGSGGVAKSVMTISGNSHVSLGGLLITQGDNSDSGIGGGINFGGTGTLKIGSTTIAGNHAGYGGGIQFKGTGSGTNVAELWIYYGTLITNNVATTSGGGIRIEGNAMLRVTDPQVLIGFNSADGGYGGGVQVIAPSHAYLGSPGYLFTEYVGLVYENTAKYGGGIAVNGSSGGAHDADLCLFATDPRHPVRIEGNIASQNGGGIYLLPVANSSSGQVSMEGHDYRITANSAQEGSALYAGNDFSTFVYNPGSYVNLRGGCHDVSLPALGAVTCTSAECNRIDGNIAQNILGQATAGSTLLLQANSNFSANPVSIIGNHSAHAIRAIGGYTSRLITYTTLVGGDNCLIADNVVASDLVLAGSLTRLSLDNCTIATNTIGVGSAAVKSAGELILSKDIFAQGGSAPSLDYTGGNPNNLTIEYVMALEAASLAAGSHVVQADPLFTDPSHGDYHLQPTSPAIDLAPTSTNGPTDLDGNPRDVDIPSVPNLDGVRDLGAYERQTPYCDAADTVSCNNFD